MARARTFAFLFTSVLLFSVFWSLNPSHFSSLRHIHGLEKVFTWLSNSEDFHKVEPQDSEKEYYRHLNETIYNATTPPTSNISYSGGNQISEAPHTTEISFDILPSADELYSSTVEVHGEKFQQVSHIENDSIQNSTSSSEPAMFLEDKDNNSASAALSHNKYFGEILNHFKADRTIKDDGETLPDITDDQVIKEMEPVPAKKVLNKQQLIYERASNQETDSFDAATSKGIFGKNIDSMDSSEINVVVLGNNNFTDFVSDNNYVVVNFYMPWFNRIQVPELEYEAAASMLKGKVIFAKVDATKGMELTRKYKSKGFYTLDFFIGGVHMHTCYPCSDRFAVVSWVKDNINGGLGSISKAPEALDFDHKNVYWKKPSIDRIDSNQDVRLELDLIENGTSLDLNTAEVFNENKAPVPKMINEEGLGVISEKPKDHERASDPDFDSSLQPQVVVELEDNTASLSTSNAKYSEPPNGRSDQQFGSVEVLNKNKTRASLGDFSDEQEVVLNKPFNEIELVVLNKENFSDFVMENKFVIVNIYKPWFYGRQDLALEYAAASFMLKGKVLFAEVDATVEKELARKYQFLGRPTLYFFIGGVHMHTYRFCCTRDPIVNWVKEKMSGGINNVTKASQAIDILQSDAMIILGFFDSLEDPISEEFAAASELVPDLIFYQTAGLHVAWFLHIDLNVKRPALFMLRKDAKQYLQFDGHFNRSSIAKFVSKNKFPLVTTFNGQIASQILSHPMKQLWLFASDHHDLEKVMPRFKEAANALNGKLLFVHINLDHKNVSYGLSQVIYDPKLKPTLIAYSGTERQIVTPMYGELSLYNIQSFGEEFGIGTLCCGPFPYSEFVLQSLVNW